MLVNDKKTDQIDVIDGKQFKEMLYLGLDKLREQKSFIDSLNVFPVPDGDTGTNMYLTLLEAVKNVKSLDSDNINSINESLAKGALMGARGNSGVILSQILRGFSLVNKSNKIITAEILTKSLKKASEVAYQGVLKPVEGTILTVSRKAAEGAKAAYDDNQDIIGIMENTIEYARVALNKTPEQLPALKEAGVVDAGGQGYLTILEGMLKGLKRGEKQKSNRTVEFELIKDAEQKKSEEILYNYCTEVLLNSNKDNNVNINKIRNDLQNYGDSLMVVGSDNIVKIHVHTNHPGIIIEYALKIGSLADVKIDNMKEQSREKNRKKATLKSEKNETKKRGVIAVGNGDGIKNILQELGVDFVIDGGQSMNPSTNDFVEAINKIGSTEVILLPNNKNIVSAAQQAASLSEKEVIVISSTSIPEAISSLLVFNEEVNLEELKEVMQDEIKKVKTAEITEAVKDSKLNGMEIKEGDIIGLCDGEIKVSGTNFSDVVNDLFAEILNGEELITIYYGEKVSEEEVYELKEKLENNFNLDEIEIYYGGQPLYPYIISLE